MDRKVCDEAPVPYTCAAYVVDQGLPKADRCDEAPSWWVGLLTLPSLGFHVGIDHRIMEQKRTNVAWEILQTAEQGSLLTGTPSACVYPIFVQAVNGILLIGLADYPCRNHHS